MWKLIHKNRIAHLLITSYNFRTAAFSAVAFTANTVYAIFNMIVGTVTGSLWCGALACYYGTLVFLRGRVLLSYYKSVRRRKDQEQMLPEIKQYRLCGIVFLCLTICLVSIVIHIVREEKVFEYQLYMIYTIAGYTLFQIIVAAVNYIKAQKNDSYTVRSLRCINLTAALVSFLSLQAVALDTFSTNVDIPLVNAFTGLVICSLIVASGVFMIVKSSAEIRKYPGNGKQPVQTKIG